MFHFKFCLAAQVAALWLVAGASTTIQAQTYAPTAFTGPAGLGSGRENVVRLDLLAPLAASVEYGLSGGHGAVVPILLSYERLLRKNTSLGLEVLLRGGTPDEHRSGAALLGRWYFASSMQSNASLKGVYLSPVLSYRALSTSPTAFNTPLNAGQRGGTGLLLGWQRPLGLIEAPHLVFDFAVGVLAWTRIGNDRTSDPGFYAYVNEPIFRRTGLLPDVRYGLGFQF